MIDFNPILSIVTLNINTLNLPIKDSNCLIGLKRGPYFHAGNNKLTSRRIDRSSIKYGKMVWRHPI